MKIFKDLQSSRFSRGSHRGIIEHYITEIGYERTYNEEQEHKDCHSTNDPSGYNE